ncbi:MAG: hypothetical protein Q8K74_10205 [Candidatus Nitrotoga sp.]|nr:hypothetical protein [Candidatus Nitrotoga sp.]MDP1856399.1 hypothetical protein [Candidatus Nitrotoga sp.]
MHIGPTRAIRLAVAPYMGPVGDLDRVVEHECSEAIFILATAEGRASCVVRRRTRAVIFARESDEKIVTIFVAVSVGELLANIP